MVHVHKIYFVSLLLLLCMQMILLYQDPENESSEDHPQQVAKYDLELEERQPKVCLSDVSD